MHQSNDLIEKWKNMEDPGFHAEENRINPPPNPFSVLSGAELRKIVLPPKVSVLGDGVIALAQLTTVIGQGGARTHHRHCIQFCTSLGELDVQGNTNSTSAV